MASKLKWFGVRRLLRTEAVGPVRHRDANYDPDGTLVEERTVIVRARDSRDAADRVRRVMLKEKIEYRNAYGQIVRSRVLEAWDSYELYEPPSDGAEVFSHTRRFAAAIPDAQVARKLVNPRLSEASQKRRLRFIAAELAHGLESIWKRPRPTKR
jgi:hypothetical protein